MCVLEVLFPLKALVRCTLFTVWTVVIILKKKIGKQSDYEYTNVNLD